MDNTPLRKALALEPADAPTQGGDSAADADAKRNLHITTTDEFLAKAANEYQTGNIDQALWRRAMEQNGGDESLVIAAYLRTRATALQLQQKKEDRPEIQARDRSRARRERQPASEVRGDTWATKFVGTRPKGSNRKILQAAAAAAGLVAIVLLVYLMVAPPQSESARQPVVAAAPSLASSAPTSPPGREQPVSKNAGANPGQGSAEPPISVTVAQLKNAGKWNVLVLNATEWTRQEPNNATAWSELGNGYAKLQQYNDALDAAKKAVQLAPGDPATWRNLGQINLAVDRLPEAGLAFEKALALRPDDAAARCGATLVGQKLARPKDTEATTRRVKPVDGGCPDATIAADAAVVPAASAPAVTPSSPVRR